MIELELATYDQIADELYSRGDEFILIALGPLGSEFDGLAFNGTFDRARDTLERAGEYLRMMENDC